MDGFILGRVTLLYIIQQRHRLESCEGNILHGPLNSRVDRVALVTMAVVTLHDSCHDAWHANGYLSGSGHSHLLVARCLAVARNTTGKVRSALL